MQVNWVQDAQLYSTAVLQPQYKTGPLLSTELEGRKKKATLKFQNKTPEQNQEDAKMSKHIVQSV